MPASTDSMAARAPTRVMLQRTSRNVRGQFFCGEDGKPLEGHHFVRAKNGAYYNGEFRGGKRFGFGEFWNPRGLHYKGYFVDGARHGQGTITFRDGGSIECEFVDNHPIPKGKGIFKYKSGGSYVGGYKRKVTGGRRGRWHKLVKDGLGTEVTRDGDTDVEYKGRWRNDVKCGAGEARRKRGRTTSAPTHFMDRREVLKPLAVESGNIMPDEPMRRVQH